MSAVAAMARPPPTVMRIAAREARDAPPRRAPNDAERREQHERDRGDHRDAGARGRDGRGEQRAVRRRARSSSADTSDGLDRAGHGARVQSELVADVAAERIGLHELRSRPARASARSRPRSS